MMRWAYISFLATVLGTTLAQAQNTFIKVEADASGVGGRVFVNGAPGPMYSDSADPQSLQVIPPTGRVQVDLGDQRLKRISVIRFMGQAETVPADFRPIEVLAFASRERPNRVRGPVSLVWPPPPPPPPPPSWWDRTVETLRGIAWWSANYVVIGILSSLVCFVVLRAFLWFRTREMRSAVPPELERSVGGRPRQGWRKLGAWSAVVGVVIATGVAYENKRERDARWAEWRKGSCLVYPKVTEALPRVPVLDLVRNPRATGTKIATYGTVRSVLRWQTGVASIYVLEGDEGGTIEVQTNNQTPPIPNTRYETLGGIVQFKIGDDGVPVPYLMEFR